MQRLPQFPVEKIILSEALLRCMIKDSGEQAEVHATTGNLEGEYRITHLLNEKGLRSETFELGLSCNNDYFDDCPSHALITFDHNQGQRAYQLSQMVIEHKLTHIADFNSGKMDFNAYRPAILLDETLPIDQAATYIYNDFIRFRADVNHPEINDLIVLADRLNISDLINTPHDFLLFSLGDLLNEYPNIVYVEHAGIDGAQLIQLEEFLSKFTSPADENDESRFMHNRLDVAFAITESATQLNVNSDVNNTSSEQCKAYEKYLEECFEQNQETPPVLLEQVNNVNSDVNNTSSEQYKAYKKYLEERFEQNQEIPPGLLEQINIDPRLNDDEVEQLSELINHLGSQQLTQDDLNNKLLFAAESGKVSDIKQWLQAGADINTKATQEMSPWIQAGDTPAVVAAGAGNLRTLVALISLGASEDPNILISAASMGRLDCVKYLLSDVKVNPNGVNEYQRTALFEVCGELTLSSATRFAVLEMLLKHGGDINQIDYQGMTPLINAVEYGPATLELAEFLLTHGADQDIDDDNGMTAGHYANAEGYAPLINLFLEWEERQSMR